MNVRSVTIKIERLGYQSDVRQGVQADYAAGIIKGLATQPEDVTITVSCSGAVEHVMLAISDTKSFLGLVGSPGVIYQYVAKGHEGDHENSRLSIAGEHANIEARYILDVDTAAAAVAEWLQAGRETSSFDRWERM